MPGDSDVEKTAGVSVAQEGESSQLIDLMNQYCDGRGAAFVALYRIVAPRLLHYAASLVADRQTAEDMLQRTFLNLHSARSMYIRGRDPVPWLYTITRRLCLDELRRRQSRTRLSQKLAAAVVAASLDGETQAGPDDRSLDDAFSERTLAALATLPEKQREALVLTKLHGRSVREAALIIGTSPTAIKQRAHRAYLALRLILRRDRDK